LSFVLQETQRNKLQTIWALLEVSNCHDDSMPQPLTFEILVKGEVFFYFVSFPFRISNRKIYQIWNGARHLAIPKLGKKPWRVILWFLSSKHHQPHYVYRKNMETLEKNCSILLREDCWSFDAKSCCAQVTRKATFLWWFFPTFFPHASSFAHCHTFSNLFIMNKKDCYSISFSTFEEILLSHRDLFEEFIWIKFFQFKYEIQNSSQIIDLNKWTLLFLIFLRTLKLLWRTFIIINFVRLSPDLRIKKLAVHFMMWESLDRILGILLGFWYQICRFIS